MKLCVYTSSESEEKKGEESNEEIYPQEEGDQRDVKACKVLIENTKVFKIVKI